MFYTSSSQQVTNNLPSFHQKVIIYDQENKILKNTKKNLQTYQEYRLSYGFFPVGL